LIRNAPKGGGGVGAIGGPLRMRVHVSHAGIARVDLHVLRLVVRRAGLVQHVHDDLVGRPPGGFGGGGGVGRVPPPELPLHLTHHLDLPGVHQEESCTEYNYFLKCHLEIRN
jgi:hypothetical protein